MPGIDETRKFLPVNIAVLTVSDSRDEASDESGKTLIDRLQAAGHHMAARRVIKDEVKLIQEQVRAWVSDTEIDVIITNGGTGITGRTVVRGIYEDIRAFRIYDGPSEVHRWSIARRLTALRGK